MLCAINIRVNHRCAFCQHCYAPTNSTIRPIRLQNAVWEYNQGRSSGAPVRRK